MWEKLIFVLERADAFEPQIASHISPQKAVRYGAATYFDHGGVLTLVECRIGSLSCFWEFSASQSASRVSYDLGDPLRLNSGFPFLDVFAR